MLSQIFWKLAIVCLLASTFVVQGQEEQGKEVGSTVTEVEEEVDRKPAFGEAITVFSASKKRERIIDAPAGMTLVTQAEIESRSSHGQIPKLLEFTPGSELTQNGIYDFNLNIRGFNTALNRRILVLIDGRDPSMPLLGAQEWSNFSLPTFELENLELLRGPSAALYGSNAVNGVLKMTTKSPREFPGGHLQLSGGQLDTLRVDVRHAMELRRDWYYRASVGYQESGSFTRSRTREVEYEGLAPEVVPILTGDNEVEFGSVRFDKYFEKDARSAYLTLEGGTATSQGVTFMTPTGRFQVEESQRPWVRLSLDTEHWNLLAARTYRKARNLQLNSGARSALDAGQTQLEIQGRTDFANGKGNLIGGASYFSSSVDSKDRMGRQTLLFEKQKEERVGIFAQVDYDFNPRIRLVAASRWDESDRYEGQFSPKLALVFGLKPDHKLRLTYNRAFQSPNNAEFFIQAPIAEPLDLSSLERALSSQTGGVPLGLSEVPLLALGNANLSVETNETLELGYKGVLGRRLFFNLDFYHSELRNFTSTLLPQLGTSLGRLNPDFGPYQPPSELAPSASEAVITALAQALPPELFAVLSNNFDGSPIFAVLSLQNVGRIDTDGIELSLKYSLPYGLQIDLGYSYLDFKVQEEVVENPILPNTSESKVSLAVAYTGKRFDAALSCRWSEGFEWRGGVFVGPVPSYDTVDFTANFQLDENWELGVNVANLFSNEHYEIFGGDLLERRALIHVGFSW